MRVFKTLLLTAASSCLLLTACSQKSEEADDVTTEVANRIAENVASDAAGGAPGLTSSAAANVAFAYRYGFTLPSDAISGVQHKHAAACEKLGGAQCKITGMDFRKADDGEISARLDFLLAPELAHRFGQSALDIVEQAEGSLGNADVTGDNAGGAIDESQMRSASLKSQLARLEQRMLIKGLPREERVSLAARASELRDQLRGEQDDRQGNEARLATTPVSFAYTSSGIFNAGDNPFSQAAETSWSSGKAMLAMVLTVLGAILPWGLLGFALLALWRSNLVRSLRGKAAPDVQP